MGLPVIRLVTGAASDVGQVRAENQDAILVAEELFAVADGMGGHRGGEVASAVALETLAAAELDRSCDALVAGVQQANRAVFEQSTHDSALAGMGTTLVVLGVIAQDGRQRLAMVNVGDSRAYLLAGDEFQQLSEDHSLVETMLRSGQLTEDEAANHPRRNVITRALGIEPEVDVDAWIIEPRPGDRFLLCSDGLFNDLDDDELAEVLRRITAPAEAATELVRLANAAGGRDNISVVLVDVVEVAGGTASAGSDTVAGVAIDDRVTRVTARSDEAAFNDTMAYGMAPVVAETPGTTPAGQQANDQPAVRSAPTAARTDLRTDSNPPPRRRQVSPERRWTWRVGTFVVAILAVVGIAFGAIAWTARSGYFLVAERGQLVLYQGQQGGLLWFDPTKIEDTGILLSDLRPVDRKAVADGQSFDDRTTADQRIDALKEFATEGLSAGSTTTTVVTSTTAVDAVTTSIVPGG